MKQRLRIRLPQQIGVLLLVWFISAAYAAGYIDRGWFPHDEGTLGQSAERVLRGELPHRDFDDVYTGGLSFLHAAVFHVFGLNLLSLRIVLFAVFLAWIPAVYSIASRFTSPVGAGLMTLLAVAWSVPNYAAALPSWYNLFFATFGIAALLRHLDTNRRRWLFIAGLWGGLSILFKIVGLYYVAAVLFFVAFREQFLTKSRQIPNSRRTPVYTALLTGLCLLFLGLVLAVTWRQMSVGVFIHFVLPPAAMAGVLLWNEQGARASGTRERLVRLVYLAVPFLVGVAVPTGSFLAFYLRADALPELFQGTFLLPMKRLSFAAHHPPYLGYSALATLPLLIFLGHRRWRKSPQRLEIAAILVLLGIVLVAAREERLIYLLPWYSVRTLGPISVVVGAWLLMHKSARSDLTEERKQQLFLILSMTAMFSLVQYPLTTIWYFWFVAPLIVLSVGAVLSALGWMSGFAAPVAGIFYLLFAVLVVNVGNRQTVGSRFLPETHLEPLGFDRAPGIRVPRIEREHYGRVVALVRARSRSEYIYASPDAPEVYFLSGYRNPTRTLFDFFDDPAGRTDRILSALDRHGVNIAVINEAPGYSTPVPRDLASALAIRFPNATRIGKFTVRWR